LTLTEKRAALIQNAKPTSWAWGLAVLLAWGVFAPTSVNGRISVDLVLLSTVLLLLLDFYMLWRWDSINHVGQLAGLGVILIPGVVTVVSDAPRIAWGALMPFSLLAVMYFLNLRAIRLTRAVHLLFIAVSLALLVLAAVTVYDSSLIRFFLVDHYSAYYDALVPNMMRAGKPVGPFATHSIAALFYYLFFFLHLRSFSVLPRHYSLALALCFLATMYLLRSNAGLAFTAIGLAQLLFVLSRSRVAKAKIYAVAIAAAAGLFAWIYRDAIEAVIVPILSSNVNGLAGRFSQSGALRANIAFIWARPFSPVGFAQKTELFYGDCGYVEMLMRGSLPLLIATYGGLVSFLRRNLLSKYDARYLLIAIGVMELGFANLTALRFLFLMPFVVVYLNGLERLRLEKAASAAR
jgi:hypothetical protein